MINRDKIKTWGNKTYLYLLKFLHIQFFITLLYLPVCLSWGLAFSSLSIIGNLIFAPFITIFLTVSSIIFFLTLLNLNPSFFCNILEKVTLLWFKLLSLSNRDSLIVFKKPPLFFILLIVAFTLTVIHLKIIKNIKHKTIILFLILITTIFLLKMYGLITHYNKRYTINYFQKDLVLVHQEKINILYDSQVLNKRGCDKKIAFNLYPQIIKESGTNLIDYLISSQPSITQFKSLTEICKKFYVKTVYMPYWTGKLSRNGWVAWQNLLETLTKYNTHLILIKEKDINIEFKNNPPFIISTQEKVRKNGLTYKAIQLINNSPSPR